MRFWKRSIQCLLGLVCFTGLNNPAVAQAGLCPSNLNFETGDFTGWDCFAGTTSSNPLPFTGPIPGRHTIINAATSGLDPFGGFPEISPLGSNYSVKLGNHSTQSQAESISYTYTIPSNLSVFSMLLYYAVVIESPGHVPSNQPRFLARIIDVATGQPIPCVNFDFIAQTNTFTSKSLLNFWFNQEHLIGQTKFSFFFSQREAIESIIYLYEVARAKDKYELMKFDSSERVSTGMFEENWTRYVVKMATGAGKTKGHQCAPCTGG